ncbi:MAG: ATP-binding cassette domain-containing protein [candidate division Zixibacteria bacterium]|nr:ATP-binding cassette domain-containing protein [candidate division Zixibacteria bacterium]
MEYYRRLLVYLKPYWYIALLGLFLMVIFALSSGFSLTMLYPAFEKVFAGKPQAPVAESEDAVYTQVFELIGSTIDKAPELYAEGGLDKIGSYFKSGFDEILAANSPLSVLEFLCLGAVLLMFIKTSSDYASKVVFVGLEQKMVMLLRNNLFRSLQKQSLDFHHKFKSGELVTRMISDVAAVRVFTIANVAEIVQNSMQIIVFLTMTIIISWKLSLIAYVVVPPLMILVGRIGHKLKKYSGRAQAAVSDTLSFLSEKISAARIVIAFGQGDREARTFEKVTGHYYRRFVKLMRLDLLARPFSELMGAVVGVAVLYYGATIILNPGAGLSTGSFMVFLAALFSMMHPITRNVKVYTDIKKGAALMARIFEVMDYEPTIKEKDDAVEVDKVKRGIEYRNVSFSYEKGVPVLRDINLEIPAGKTVALVGPSGGGKSTLADLLPRFYDPDSGSIAIDGIDIRDLSLRSLRGLLGIVTQEIILFNDTIAANISYGKPDATIEEIKQASELANARDFIEGFEKGFDTLVGERGSRLSGGQRQRIAIARAILNNPQILIFDEATSALDNESERAVQEAVSNLLRDRTTLVIAHRLSTIVNSDKIVVIDNGVIVDAGAHEELLGRCPLYSRLYETEFTTGALSAGKEQ